MKQMVIVEGVDLSGKTTFINQLENELSRYSSVKIIPSILEDTDNGKLIRKILQDSNTTEQQLRDLIQNYLLNDFLKSNLVYDYMFDNVDYIIQDRSIVTSFVYQNFNREEIKRYLHYLRYQTLDSVYIYLNTPIDVIKERLKNRDGHTEVYESLDRIVANKERYERLFGLNSPDVKELALGVKESSFYNNRVISIDSTDTNSTSFKYIVDYIL